MSKCITCIALRDGICLLQGCKPTSDCGSYRPLSHVERARLKEENAKLRELCKDLFGRLMGKDERCGECRSQCEHDAWNFGNPKCMYAKRMCELGIEVD